MKQRPLSHPHLLVCLVLAFIGLAYLPALFYTFGFDDDYWQLVAFRFGDVSYLDNMIVMEGRPLYAWLIIPLMRLMGSVENLVWARLIGIGGILLCALMTYRISRKAGHDEVSSMLVMAFVALNPAMATFSFFGTMCFFPYACALAMLGGWITLRGFEQDSRLKCALIGGGLLFLSILTYQPAGGCFALPFVLYVLKGRSPCLRPVAAGICVLGATMAAYLILYKLSGTYLFEDHPRTHRASVLGNLPERFSYFVRWDVLASLRGWFELVPSKWVLYASAIAGSLLVICAVVAKPAKSALLKLLLLIVLITLAGLPLLGANPPFAPFRALIAMQMCVAAAVALGLAAVFAWIPRLWPTRASIACLILTVGLCLLTADILRKMVFQPQAQEWHQARTFVEEHLDAFPSGLVYRQVEGACEKRPYRPLHEYGSLTKRKDWVLETTLENALIDVWAIDPQQTRTPPGDFFHLQFIRSEDTETFSPYLGFNIAHDVWKFVPEDSAPAVLRTSHMPLLGDLAHLGSGWTDSRIGPISWYSADWFYHPKLGWMQNTSKEDAKWLILYSKQLGYLYLENYPEVMVLSTRLHTTADAIHQAVQAHLTEGAPLGKLLEPQD